MSWPIKKLGEVIDYEQPTEYLVGSKDYKDEYLVPVLTAGKSFLLGNTNEKNGIFPKEKLPVIIFDDFTTATKFVDFPFKVKSSAMKILHAKKNIADISYLFYNIQTINFKPAQHKRYWISEYSNIKIPLPPLATQKQIVERLDKIAESQKLNDGLIKKTDELFQSLLHKELNPAGPADASTFVKTSAGKKAMAGKKDWEVKKLGEVIEINYGKGLLKDSRIDSGEYFAYGSNGPVYKTNKSLTQGETIMIGRKGTAGALYFVSEPCWPIDTTFFAKSKNNMSLKFIYYLLQIKRLPKLAITTGVPGINRTTLSNVGVHLPPLKVQKRIVAKLSAVQSYKKELMEQKIKLKELFNSVLHKSMNSGLLQ